MKTCPACGNEVAAEADFCSCGEYLRWEPTGFMPAIEAPAAESAAVPAPPPPAPRVSSATAHGYVDSAAAQPRAAAPQSPPAAAPPAPAAAPPAPAAPAAPRPAPSRAAAPPPPPAAAPAPKPDLPETASITLRLPDADGRPVGPVALGVEPGHRGRVLGLVRNQSGVVDNYDLEIKGLPSTWYTITPATVYLVPFGAAGAYEQEVLIELHPPRTAEAVAKIWQLTVTAQSKAEVRTAAVAPLALGILPFEQLEFKVSPERRSARIRARYDVTVRNRSNAPASVALGAVESEGLCRTRFSERTLDVAPGETGKTRLTVRPRRQRPIGRPEERRIEVSIATGEEGERLLTRDDEANVAQKRKLGIKLPQISKPDINIGPGGVRVQAPRLRAPQFPSVRVGEHLPPLELGKLRPAGEAPPSAPLLPGQVVFRHRAWLPWWLAVVLPLLLVLAMMLFLFLPRNAVVPEVVGAASVFDAQGKLEDVGLVLDPTVQQISRPSEKPGTVIGQAPKAGKKVKKGAAVVIQVAIGTGTVKVPNLVGVALPDAEKLLRTAGLVVGRTSVTPPDLKAKISSQIPAANEAVKEGGPVDIYYGKAKTAGGAGGPDAGKDGGGGDIAIPAIDPKDAQGYSAKLADAGLVPQAVQQFSEAPKGEVFNTEPLVGQKLGKGAAVKVFVSAGFPQLIFDDDKNVLRIDGATGKRLAAVAKTDQIEKDATWSADGTHVAYNRGGQIMFVDVSKDGAQPVALTPTGERFADPSLAPTPERNVIAMSEIEPTAPNDRNLCVGLLGDDGVKPQCIKDPKFSTADAKWSADGKTIWVPAVGAGGFGIVRYRSSSAFSPRASDWKGGNFVTPRDAAGGTGVRDIAVAPDGKTVAVVANTDTPQFRLYLTTLDDLRLEKAKPTQIQACKVIWRPDGKELVVVQAGEDCNQATGQLFRIAIGKTDEAVPLSASGDNPSFQPLTSGGG